MSGSPHPRPHRRSGRRIAALAAAGLVLALALAPGRSPAAGPGDAGIELEIDRATSVLRARDARSGEAGPSLPVVVGSPAHPTPIGRFRAGRVILRPSWTPGPAAREAGAEPAEPSLRTPMGVAKIPFADGGSIALHGAGDPRLLGKPVSTGCVRAGDAELLLLLVWLRERGVLGPPVARADGEVERPFVRPVRVAVR